MDQSSSPSQRQRFPPLTPETPTHGSTPTHSDTPDQQQKQIMIQLQHNQALLEMNRLSLLPHQKEELLHLQLQLNHLQQLSLKQQIKTQQLQEEASHLSPGSPLVKNTTRSALCARLSPRPSFSHLLQFSLSVRITPVQPRPWPLPPPRVASTEPDSSNALSPHVSDAVNNRQDASATEKSEPSLEKLESLNEQKAEQSSVVAASLQAADPAPSPKTFSEQQSERTVSRHVLHLVPSQIHVHGPPQVHPSVVNAIDAPRTHAGEGTSCIVCVTVGANESPQPRGPANRLMPPNYPLPAAGTDDHDDPHFRLSELRLTNSFPAPEHSPVGPSVDEQTSGAASRPSDGYTTPKQPWHDLQARLGFASGGSKRVLEQLLSIFHFFSCKA
jgi:hypothetical protein